MTNFFTFDLGRPLHVFDVAKLAGDVLTLRRGAGETMRALNGKDYVLDPEDCAICDAAGVQSIAGVIGGEATGCDETTTTVFVECALFDPVRIALTGRRHQIVSDARQRFERGLDPALMPDAIEAATALILDLCGGEPGDGDRGRRGARWQRDATLRFARFAGLGGSDIPADEAVASLERLGFLSRHRDAERVTVAVPSWRNDVAAPIRAGPVARRWTRRKPPRPRKAAPRSSRNATWSRKCCACAAWTRSRRSRCRAPDRCPRPTLTPRQQPHRPGPPHAGRARSGRMRHLQLHGSDRGRAVSATRRTRCG